MARKAGLGRGLDALFADVVPIDEKEYTAESIQALGEDRDVAAPSAKVADNRGASGAETTKVGVSANQADSDIDRILYIDINDIKPNSAQPRVNFNEEKLAELAESIKSNGVIQPLIVRRGKTGYELVAGERRWRASRIAGLREVPCILRDFDDRQNAIVAIIENMQREDLDPIEEARGLKAMTEKYGFTQAQVSTSLGKSRTYITNSIRLLKLPEDIIKHISDGDISAAHGRTIINVSDAAKQREIVSRIIRNDLSVRATEKLAEQIKNELEPNRKPRKNSHKSSTTAKSEAVVAVENELMTLTGTKVNITGEDKGKLEFEFYSTEELNRLIEIIRGAFR